MIGYVTLGTQDIKRAAEFYDVLLEEFGATRFDDREEFILWGSGSGEPTLGVSTPFDGNPATVGNGVMVSLETTSRDQVHAVYEKAMELGAKDEGAPRPRGDKGFYGAYF